MFPQQYKNNQIPQYNQMRNTNGDKLEDIDFFMGHLIDQSLHFGQSLYLLKRTGRH